MLKSGVIKCEEGVLSYVNPENYIKQGNFFFVIGYDS